MVSSYIFPERRPVVAGVVLLVHEAVLAHDQVLHGLVVNLGAELLHLKLIGILSTLYTAYNHFYALPISDKGSFATFNLHSLNES